jgi:molybdopterin-biosynthesis enzyme MoeA-like protein
MTLKAIAVALGKEVKLNEEALLIVERQYKNLFEKGIVKSPELTEARIKMARLPEGAVPLDNRVGGAPGTRLEEDNTVIFSLPGVPSELKFIFEDSIIQWISDRVVQKFFEQVIEFGMHDESVFSPAIDVVMKKHPGVYIKSMPKTYGTSKTLRVWISLRGENLEDITERVKQAILSLEQETGLPSKNVES